MSRHYTDIEWARIMAGVWSADDASQTRKLMTVKKLIRSERLNRDYGCVLRPVRLPSRDTVLWFLSNIEAGHLGPM